MLKVYDLRPDVGTAIVVETATEAETSVRFMTYWAEDFISQGSPPDTVFVEGTDLNCHDRFSDCRAEPSRQVWCDGDSDNPWAFELRGNIADTRVAIQGTDVTDGDGCEFDVSFYELDYNTLIGQSSIQTQFCDAMHDNWQAANE